jgi:hypothetical protein
MHDATHILGTYGHPNPMPFWTLILISIESTHIPLTCRAGSWDCEDSTIGSQMAVRLSAFHPQEDSLFSFLLEAVQIPGPWCGWKDCVNWKYFNYLIGIRTRDRPACNIFYTSLTRNGHESIHVGPEQTFVVKDNRESWRCFYRRAEFEPTATVQVLHTANLWRRVSLSGIHGSPRDLEPFSGLRLIMGRWRGCWINLTIKCWIKLQVYIFTLKGSIYNIELY